MIIGYARVSTNDQNLDLQLDALKKAECEMIFTDKVSGTVENRPELKNLKSKLRKGDTLVVWKLNRLFRSLKHLIEWKDYLEVNEIQFVSVMDNIDTTSSMGRFMFHLLGAISQLERDIISENTKAGLESARSRGRVGGRPKKADAKKIERIKELYKAKEMTVKEICTWADISKGTFYKYVKSE